MNYCSECGQEVVVKTPEDDHRPRFVCEHCNTIHYQNPRIITGTLPVAPDGRVLLCRRNIEPRKNYWTLPGGFMENGETTIEGALRETAEESCVKAINPELLSIISLPNWNQVHVFYRVDMPDFSYELTPESNEIELFSEAQIPWDHIAFRTVAKTLKHYFAIQDQPFFVLNDHIQL